MSDSTLIKRVFFGRRCNFVPFIFELIAIISMLGFLNPANDTIFLASVGLLVFDALIVMILYLKHNKGV